MVNRINICNDFITGRLNFKLIKFYAAKISIFLVVICFWGCKSTQTVILPNTYLVEMKADVKFLSSDELEGRETGTEGERKAAAYIEKRFQALGLKGIFHERNSFYQMFEVIRLNDFGAYC